MLDCTTAEEQTGVLLQHGTRGGVHPHLLHTPNDLPSASPSSRHRDPTPPRLPSRGPPVSRCSPVPLLPHPPVQLGSLPAQPSRGRSPLGLPPHPLVQPETRTVAEPLFSGWGLAQTHHACQHTTTATAKGGEQAPGSCARLPRRNACSATPPTPSTSPSCLPTSCLVNPLCATPASSTCPGWFACCCRCLDRSHPSMRPPSSCLLSSFISTMTTGKRLSENREPLPRDLHHHLFLHPVALPLLLFDDLRHSPPQAVNREQYLVASEALARFPDAVEEKAIQFPLTVSPALAIG